MAKEGNKDILKVRLTEIDDHVRQLLDEFKAALPTKGERDDLLLEVMAINESIKELKSPLDRVGSNTKELRDFYAQGGYSGQASRAGAGDSTGDYQGSRSSGASNRGQEERPSQQGGYGFAGSFRRALQDSSSGGSFSERFWRNHQGLEDHNNWGVDIRGWEAGKTPAESMRNLVAKEGGFASHPPAMPQFGQYTAQNMLAYAGSKAQQWSSDQYEQLLEDRIQKYMKDPELQASREDAEIHAKDWLRGEEDIFGETFNNNSTRARLGDKWAKMGRRLHGGAEIAGGVSLAHQVMSTYGYDFRTHTISGTGGLEGLGEKLGVSGSGMDIGPLRIPGINPAARKGLQEQWEMTKMAMSPGINKTQANFIFDQLYDRGWLGGEQTNVMREGSKHIMQYNKQLGMNPQTYDAMDKSLRHGTITMEDFVRTMKRVPEAAKSARVSLDQMVADANAMGEQNQEFGGTFAQGYKNAMTISEISGLPAGVVGAGFNNPIVQGYSTVQSGLPPQLQGLLPGGQRMAGVMSAVNSMKGAVSGIGSKSVTDPATGLTRTISGEDQQIAWLHQMFPEYSPEVLKAMTNPKTARQIKDAGQISDWGEQWSRQGTMDGKGKGSWANFKQSHIKGAKRIDPDTGELVDMFTKDEIKEIEKAGKLDRDGGSPFGISDTDPRVRDAMKKPKNAAQKRRAGESDEDYQKRLEGMFERTGRYNKMKEILAEKGDNAMDGNPNKVTIELSETARKALHIKGGKKSESNAGGSSVNIPFSRGATTPPQPYIGP